MITLDDIRGMLSDVFEDFYAPAQLETYATGTTRDPNTGNFPQTRTGTYDCRVQRDECTEAQRSDPGYTSRDVRLMVLQRSSGATPDTDSRILFEGRSYRVMAVSEDPASVYWDCRARAI